jgi:O-antigen/teichoic acid export membrane protein
MGWLMPWVIALGRGEEAAGMLAACTSFVGLSNVFVNGLDNFLSPRAAQAYAEGGREALMTVLAWAGLVFVGVLGSFCLFTLAVGERALTLVYGGDYGGAQWILTLLALSVLARSVGMVAGTGLWAIDRPRANLSADVSTLIITVGLGICLVGSWSVLGIAIATLAGAATSAFVRVFTLRRVLAELRRSAVLS